MWPRSWNLLRDEQAVFLPAASSLRRNSLCQASTHLPTSNRDATSLQAYTQNGPERILVLKPLVGEKGDPDFDSGTGTPSPPSPTYSCFALLTMALYLTG